MHLFTEACLSGRESGGLMARWKVTGSHRYFVREGPYESEIRVVSDPDQQTIMTTLDVLSPNSLENLPPARSQGLGSLARPHPFRPRCRGGSAPSH